MYTFDYPEKSNIWHGHGFDNAILKSIYHTMIQISDDKKIDSQKKENKKYIFTCNEPMFRLAILCVVGLEGVYCNYK